MADLGATVLKVESEGSDLAMTMQPPIHKGDSGYYEHMNAGKKSVVLNLGRFGHRDSGIAGCT